MFLETTLSKVFPSSLKSLVNVKKGESFFYLVSHLIQQDDSRNRPQSGSSTTDRLVISVYNDHEESGNSIFESFLTDVK